MSTTFSTVVARRASARCASGDDNPTEIKFSKEFDVVLGCVDHNNTATFTTNDTATSD